MVAPIFLSLAGELRNLVYNFVLEDLEHVTIRDGQVVAHALAQVCQQTRSEFNSMLKSLDQAGSERPRPARTTLQVENFDFEASVKALQYSFDASDTAFDIQVRITKQLERDQWAKMWPWVQFCDGPASQGGNKELRIRYDVHAKLGACNIYAACHMLYVEVVPYILKGDVGGGRTSAGYQQIEKMRTALSGSYGLLI